MAQRTGPVNVTEDIKTIENHPKSGLFPCPFLVHFFLEDFFLFSILHPISALQVPSERMLCVPQEYDDDDLTLLNVPQEAVGFVTGR